MNLSRTAILLLAALTAPTLAFSSSNGPASPQDRSESTVPLAADADTSTLACYFSKGSDITWYWGLTSDSAWFSMSGSWTTTTYTKNQKFFATTSQSSMAAACNNAMVYYKLVGYTNFAYFAATANAGSNYPIVVNGTQELFSNY